MCANCIVRSADRTPHALKLGDLAYLDTFAGMVPVKVIAAGFNSQGDAYMTYRITANRGAYKRGEQLAVWSSVSNRFRLVPRGSVRGQHIRNDWHWLIDDRRVDIF